MSTRPGVHLLHRPDDDDLALLAAQLGAGVAITTGPELPDPARFANLPDYLSKRNRALARRSASSSGAPRRSASSSGASSSFPAGPFVAPVGYEIMAKSDTEASFNWSQPVLQQRTRWARLCGMVAWS